MTDKAGVKIEIKDLRFSYNLENLLSIDYLKIDEPGITVILGPNGAGKSLLLKLLQGIERPTNGEISILGISDSKKINSQCMVLQTPIFLRLSVYQNIAMCLKRHRFFLTGNQKNKIKQILHEFGLENKINFPAKLLSGGQKQKLSLARAIAFEPSILLVDEPTSTIDPSTTLFIERFIKSEEKRGTKIIFVTHDINQASRLAREAIMICNGNVVEQGCAKTFFKSPKSKYARDYLTGKLYG